MIDIAVEIEEVGHINIVRTERVLVGVGAPGEGREGTRGSTGTTVRECRGEGWAATLLIDYIGVGVAHGQRMAVLLGDVDQDSIDAEADTTVGVSTLG